MTKQEPEDPHFATSDGPDTEVISVATPAPVFVDSTGRRSRLLRRTAYGFGVLVMAYGGLISVSLAGGPVRSSAVLPLPGLEPAEEETPTRAPAPPSPAPVAGPSHQPTVQPATVAQPRRAATPRTSAPRLESATVRPARPTVTRTPSTTPRPVTTTTRPVESATTQPPASTSATPSSSAPTSEPVVPVPPRPAVTPTGRSPIGSSRS